ncbi:response regulator [Natronoglycomyces albus]|uniref:Response regulator transcription factor n=1 Tax=Natronoglycomyces albus TaxID=2811108 RepID=A0A895XLG9_9ACTN|nr:response regulator transcription factor [Natronoglycomyces albus]QSB04642.1 response regulator transcription factor [Natronoglycomyces albus]
MTTVLIVDDHALQRMGFRMLLETQEDLEVVGEAENGTQAVQQVRSLRPDVVLMDIRMPKMDGIAATGAIVADNGPTRVLLLTTFDLDEYAMAGLRAGASGFLIKDAQPEDLLSGIRAVASGDAVVAPRLTRRLLDRFINAEPVAPSRAITEPLARLTDRERQILTVIGQGWSNTEIAQRLHVSESTVKTHVGRIFNKIQVRDRVHAVIFAYNAGLVAPQQNLAGPAVLSLGQLSEISLCAG